VNRWIPIHTCLSVLVQTALGWVPLNSPRQLKATNPDDSSMLSESVEVLATSGEATHPTAKIVVVSLIACENYRNSQYRVEVVPATCNRYSREFVYHRSLHAGDGGIIQSELPQLGQKSRYSGI
jgi:hypothetical protein